MNTKLKDYTGILNEILLKHFSPNVYFSFSEFYQIVRLNYSEKEIDYEKVKEYILNIIDNDIIEQIYVNGKENPFLTDDGKKTIHEKSIHFKLLIAKNENKSA